MQGKASLFVRGLPGTSKESVAALYSALKKKYINPRATQSYALAFDQATQQPREDLDDFLRHLQRKVRLGFPSSTENDARVTHKFISGMINDSVRLRLLERGFYKQDGMCEALENVLVATQELTSILQTSSDGPSICTIQKENTQLRQQVNELAKNVEELEASAQNRPTSGNSPQGKQPGVKKAVRCWYLPCGKTHSGGWAESRLSKRREPDWKPRRLCSPGEKSWR